MHYPIFSRILQNISKRKLRFVFCLVFLQVYMQYIYGRVDEDINHHGFSRTTTCLFLILHFIFQKIWAYSCHICPRTIAHSSDAGNHVGKMRINDSLFFFGKRFLVTNRITFSSPQYVGTASDNTERCPKFFLLLTLPIYVPLIGMRPFIQVFLLLVDFGSRKDR